ncbi:MAG: MG2 domain-containing protein [Candidatus Absconditabacteria bacterium]
MENKSQDGSNKFTIYKEKVINYYKKNTQFCINSGIIFFLGIFTIITGHFYVQNYGTPSIFTNIVKNLIPQTAFEVNSANFDFSMKKIPYNIKYLEVNFTKEIDSSTLTGEVFTISPKVAGIVEQPSPNTIRYVLSTPLENDKNYEVFISKDIKSQKGESFDKDITYFLQTTQPAKVTKIIPDGSLDDLSKNITILFNLPLVHITNIEKNEILPCPIKVTPNLNGRCKRTTTNMIEYMPLNGIQGATKYSVQVVPTSGLLYELEGTESIDFSTPKLQIYTGNNVEIEKGIEIISNFPIDLKQLESKIKLIGGDNKEIPFTISYVEKSESKFSIKPKNQNIEYGKEYKLEIDKGLMPKYGNIPTEKPIILNDIKFDFVSGVQIYRNIFSFTGELIDTRYIYYNSGYDFSQESYFDENYHSEYGYLPIKDLVFHINLQKEVILNKNFFSLTDQSGSAVEFDLSYISEETEILQGGNLAKVNQENKKRIKITIKGDLINNTEYSLIIKKGISPNISNDIIYKYKSAPSLTFDNFISIDYSKSCIYTSTPIKLNINKTKINTTPISRINSFEEYVPWGIIQEGKKIQNIEKLDKYYLDNGFCPPAKNGQHLTTLNTRLNPNSKYDIIFSGDIIDIYGNRLVNETIKTIETKEIKDSDIYIYSSLSKYVNVIPKDLPIILNIQSINTQKAKFQLCEADIDGFIYFKDNGIEMFFDKYCKSSINKELELKNNHWILTNNKFDLEKDILGKAFSKNFIFVRGTGTSYESGYGKEFYNLFIRSNLTLNLEEGINQNILLATDLYGKEIKDNLKFRVFDQIYDNTNYKYFTKENKLFQSNYIQDKSTYSLTGINNSNLIMAYSDNEFGLIVKDQDYLDNYSFNFVGGNTSYSKNFLYLYTDRPLYKPGEKVYYKGILREFSYEGYKKSSSKKGNIILMDKSRNKIKEFSVEIDNNSNFDGEFELPKDIALGEYKFDFKLENGDYVGNNGNFYIEEFQKPVFKVEVTQDKQEVKLGDNTNMKINPEYYFGGKIVNTVGNFKIMKQNYFFDAKDYSDYQFGIGYDYFNCLYWGDCSYSDELQEFKDFVIDKDGNYNFKYLYPQDEDKGEKIYNFTFTVTDPDTQKTVSKTVSQVLHTTDGYIGIKTPYWNSKQGVEMKGVIVDWDGKGMKDRNAEIQLIQREWKTVKKQGVDGVFYSDYSLVETIESTIKVKTNEKGEFSQKFTPKNSGEYSIKGIYTGTNGKKYTTEDIIYIAGDEYISWQVDNNNITELVGEKMIMNIGDSQEYLLKSPVNNGKAIIFIEKDDGILDFFIHDIKSYGDKISIKVQPNYYPNFYVKAFLVGQENTNPLPIYKRALTITKVNTEYKNLKVEIITDKKSYLPGDPVNLTINVKDENGQPVNGANGHISIVDESLLALKGNPKRNPFAYFYDMKRGLRTNSYSNLASLIEKLEIKDASDGAKGGDGEDQKGGQSSKKRGTFKNTAYWLANFTTDENGQFTIQTEKLPDNLTTWEIEVIVNTPGDLKVGIDYHSIVTTKELIINDNLPRFLGANDEITFSPVIFNKTGKEGKFKVTIDANNIEIKEKEFTLNLKDQEQKTILFQGIVGETNIGKLNESVSTINIKVQGESHVDEIEKTLRILDNSTPEQISTFGKYTQNPVNEIIDITNIKNNYGKIIINYSTSLLSSINEGIEYLNNFPYGCFEQKVSAIMPNVYLKYMYDSLGIEYDLNKIYVNKWESNDEGYKQVSLSDSIKEILSQITTYQSINGGYVYWAENNKYGDFDLTSYIIESISKLRGLGFTYDEKSLEKAIAYLNDRFYKNTFEGSDNKYSEYSRLNAIHAILSYNPNYYEGYKMWKILTPNESIDYKFANLKVISKLIKMQDIKDEEKKTLKESFESNINNLINNNLIINPRGAYIDQGDGYNRLETTSEFIYLVSEYGLENFGDIQPIIDNMIRWIISQKNNGSFGSTQTNIKVIKSIISYIKRNGEIKDVDLNVDIMINGESVDSKAINNTNKLETFTKEIILSDLNEQNSFKINKTGSGNLYYDLNLTYYLPAKNIKATNQGFRLDVKYYRYNDYKMILTEKEKEYKLYMEGKVSYEDLKYTKEPFDYISPVFGGKVGEVLIAANEISTGEPRDKVSFEGFIPAGSELVNTNLATEEGSKIQDEYQGLFSIKEFRDDRFYGYIDMLPAGTYKNIYVFRLTHAGEFNIKPSRIFEFYNEEVFGRNKGKVFNISK